MLFRLRYIIVACTLLLTTWLVWTSYSYFFDKDYPTLSISGLDDDGCYSGDIPCKVAASKKGHLTVYLDKKPLINNYWLSVCEQGHPFCIPSKTISNGKHNLEITLADGSYNKNQTKIERSFYVDNVPLQAAFVRPESDYKVFQGRTLHVQFQVNKEIKEAQVQALASKFEAYPESKKSSVWECYIPISCEEAPNEYLFSIDVTDKVGNLVTLENKFQVVQYPFKKQNLQVSAEKVAEEKQKGEDTALLEERIVELLAQSPHEKLWKGPFVNPIDVARITCDFGTIRTTQEKGRYMHKGVDLINMPKSVVWAPQNGIVVHKDRYAFTGNTVVIDHGYGIFSLFFHLDSIADITEGQKIAQGNPIGTLGKTGYATGYHLHWEMRVNNVHVDPIQWTKNTF